MRCRFAVWVAVVCVASAAAASSAHADVRDAERLTDVVLTTQLDYLLHTNWSWPSVACKQRGQSRRYRCSFDFSTGGHRPERIKGSNVVHLNRVGRARFRMTTRWMCAAENSECGTPRKVMKTERARGRMDIRQRACGSIPNLVEAHIGINVINGRCATARRMYRAWGRTGDKATPVDGWKCSSRGTPGTDEVHEVRCYRKATWTVMRAVMS